MQLLCLPVLGSVAPPSLHRWVAAGGVLQIIEARAGRPVCDGVFEQ